jgi:hypothetical protein
VSAICSDVALVFVAVAVIVEPDVLLLNALTKDGTPRAPRIGITPPSVLSGLVPDIAIALTSRQMQVRAQTRENSRGLSNAFIY